MLRAIVLLLTCAAGSVDAASWFALGHVFTANMTGNTIHLGVAIGRWDVPAVERASSVLAAFVLGAGVGALIVERDDVRERWPRSVTWALVLELVILMVAALTWLPGWPATLGGQLATLALLAIAMGVQSAAVRRLRIPGVVTTYITGTVTTFAAGIVRRRVAHDKPTPEAPTHGAALLALVWLVYLAGAVVSTLWASARGVESLLLPIILLAAAIAGAVWHRRASARSASGT